MKGFTRTMNLNRNLTKTLLAAAVALGTLCSSSAAFAATGSHAASTKAQFAKELALKPASRPLTRTSGPGYDGGKATRLLTWTSGPGYTGGKAGRLLTRTFGPEYDGG
jgi:hypothetical protein